MDEHRAGKDERGLRPEEPRRGRGRGEQEGLSLEELEAQDAGELPGSGAMSPLGIDVAIPADPTIAADVLTGDLDPAVAEKQHEEEG
jgi:hypothetical protein